MTVDREKALQVAQRHTEAGHYDQAIAEYQRVVAADPTNVRALLKLGDVHAKLRQFPQAVSTYERVAQLYASQGHWVKAIAVYKSIRETIRKHAPELEDHFIQILPRLAECCGQVNMISDAVTAYDELATRLQRAGRDRDVIEVFRKVVDLDPSHPISYIRLGEAYVRVGDSASAITRFRAAGEIFMKLGRHDDALKVFERLLKHREDGLVARTMAEIHLQRGGKVEARAALQKLSICLREDPRDLDTLALFARAFDELGEPQKAIEVQKESARVARDAGVWSAFGRLVDILLERAPHDEEVQQMAKRARATSSLAPGHAPASDHAPASSVVEEIEEVDIDEVVESEAAPFALRQPVGDGEPASLDQSPASQIRAALTRAEALRAARNYDPAIALLRSTLASQPLAYEVHERLCDVLLEAGDQETAVRQMLSFAHIVGTHGDPDRAARVLDEVLLLEPEQPEALRMLSELGYAVPAAPAGGDEIEFAAPEFAPPSSMDEPLPSYDLEEVGVDQALYRGPLSMAPPAVASSPVAATEQLDDPFGETPLPSFPIEDEATHYMEPNPAFAGRPMGEPAGGPAIASLDEDALEEAEFFTTHGMFDEAAAILDQQLARLPNHPLLALRKRELQATIAAQRASVAQAPRAPTAPISAASHATLDLDAGFDIAASLDALDALEPVDAHQAEAHDPRQVSVESVFEQFKAGVKAQISESDAATHYDLGVAYREMGLMSEAISEFELASRDPGRECVCWSMIGMLRLETGEIDGAIDSFIRGLHSTQRTPEQELALTYEIGHAYEYRNNPGQALYYFQLVERADPNYADPRGSVRDRIGRLMPLQQAPRAVGDLLADDFDTAFDDLLIGKKLP